MQLVNLKQGSSEWLEFRRAHLGASDASVIMGLNPWKTLLQLYEEKIFKIEKEDNYYMARGRELEPLALESFENETGFSMFPMVFKHETISFMSASMDGISIDRKIAVEIKCAGKVDHSKALKGIIPEKYLPQLQHQMEVCELDMIYYYSFDGEKGVTLEVKRDQEFIEKMLEKEKEFWHCLKALKPPVQNNNKRINHESATLAI